MVFFNKNRNVRKRSGLSCCLNQSAICPLVLDGNHIDGFAFVILAKHLKPRPTECEGITFMRHRGMKGMKRGFN